VELFCCESQRLLNIFVEWLEESALLGRLPDLWPDFMPRIVGRLLRGMTIQTGVSQEVPFLQARGFEFFSCRFH